MNIARVRVPLTNPAMAGFTSQLDRINALADDAPGFLWRLDEHRPSEPLDAESLADLEDYALESILVNLSAWESVEALQQFVYHEAHGAMLKGRREWFEKFEGRWSVLWWTQERPTVAEGRKRLDHLRARGETEYAFNFKVAFPKPSEGGADRASASSYR